jgi:general secretion pathway protein A
MYETFYGFREKPFSLVPDPDFLYLGKHHRAALNILEYGLMGEASFALISGEVGSGKTILIRRFLRMVDPQTTVGLITNTHASLGNLLDWILLAFDLDYRGKEKVELFDILTEFLRDQRARGRRTVLIIDEAQNMEPEMLEELRMLSNINVDKDLMFQIVLAGPPEILDKINRPELRQLAQRISANFHLSPLTLDETRDYICHRLAVAGGRRDIFDNLACAGVYYFTEGLPRPVNIICDAALVYGFGEERESISLETILDVVENVQRSGLKALRSLENGFDREQLTIEITALAKTYVRTEPPEEDLGDIMVGQRQPRPDAAGNANGQENHAREPGEQEIDPIPVAARDVPAGIPLAGGGGHEGWDDRDFGAGAVRKRKWRRLFDAAAVAILVLVAAISLLRGLNVWSEPPAPASDGAGQAEPSERSAAAPEMAAKETNDDTDGGPIDGLLTTLGLISDDAGTPNGTPNQDTETSVTISLPESGNPDQQPADAGGQSVGTIYVDEPEPSPAETETATADGQDEDQAGTPATSDGGVVQTANLPATGNDADYTHWIRLGTFRRQESAPILWQRLQHDEADLLQGLSYQIAKVQEGEQDTKYLLRAGPLPDAAAARTLCRDLRARGVDCVGPSTRGDVAALTPSAPSGGETGQPTDSTPTRDATASKDAYLYKLALVHSEEGQSYSKSGSYDKAIKEFNEAIRLNPGLAAAYYNRGEIYFQRGDYAQAIRDFTRTIDLSPDYTFAYYSRGVANERIGDIEEAILDFTNTVRLKPSYAPAYNDRARAFYSLRHLPEALRDSELAISVAPDTPSYLATHSQILAALGRKEGAFATLERAMELANAEWIKRSQQAMSRDGYYRGPIDGRYGPETKSAMRACLVSGCNLAEWN